MTATTIEEKPQEDRLKREREFTDVVRGWHKDDNSRLSILRRCAGGTLTQAITEGRRVSWMYALSARFPEYKEEALFLTATLLAFDRRFLDGHSAQAGSFGQTMARLKNTPGVSEQSLERRFAILLDADYDPLDGSGELPYRLRQIVKYALSKEGQIDWPRLLADVHWWNDPRRIVQKQWARDFYAPLMQSSSPTQEEQTQGETDAD